MNAAAPVPLEDATLALLGQRGSGKTTFLGALLDGLDSGRVRSLQRAGRPADARPLRSLTEALLAGRYPLRTAKSTPQELALPLRRSADPQERAFALQLSDYDGQEIEDLFMIRTSGWSAAWRARATVRHLLLFLRAPTSAPPADRQAEEDPWARLSPRPAVRPAPSGAQSFAPQRPEEHFSTPALYEQPQPPALAAEAPLPLPQALPLVEVLQFLRAARGLDPGERPAPGVLRVAVGFTAWDAVHPAWRSRGPAALLSAYAPLLSSFLWANFHEEDVACFGLSATGGDLNDPAYRARYQAEEDDACGFVEWRYRDLSRRAPDLGVPLCFLLSGEAALEMGEVVKTHHG